MVREAYRSLYGDLLKIKDDAHLSGVIGTTGDDTEIWELLAAVSDWVDHYCNRHFYPRQQTLELDGSGTTKLLVPDLLTLDTIKEDTNDDKTFNETWAATDYWLLPYNAEPTQHWGKPYTQLGIRAHGAKQSFSAGEQHFELAGRWGYRESQEASGSLLNDASMDTTKTAINIDDGSHVEIGQTIMLGTEQLLITAISSNNLTCTRGLNGTTPAAHADDTQVNILRWPPGIESATLIQTARIWVRAPKFEPFFVDQNLDPDVRAFLEPYRRLAV